MNNFLFLTTYLRLQEGIQLTGLIDLGFALIGYSRENKSYFFNLALTDKLIDEKELAIVKDNFRRLKRQSTFYFENKEGLTSLKDFLEKKNYKKLFEDSWLFYEKTETDKTHFESARKVTDEEELEIFLETFSSSYQRNDPQNPYGTQDEHIPIMREIWRKYRLKNRLAYFVVYKGNKPVAVSALNNYGGLGYIYGVGSLKEVRGEGYGKAATLYAVEYSKNYGNLEHFTGTEEGTFPNEFYKRIGFKTRLTAVGYSLKKRETS